MAKFIVTGPDGVEYEIEAPDDASEEQVLAYAQQEFSKVAPAPAEAPAQRPNPTEGMSGLDQFRAGVGQSIAQTGRGLGQLGYETVGGNPVLGPLNLATGGGVNRLLGREPVGALIQQGVEEGRRLDAPLLDTPGGFWGSVTGSVAQMAAAPGGGGVGFLAKAPGAAAQGAGFSMLQPVGEGESRLQNTLVGGGLGVVGQGLASGGQRLAQGALARLEPAARRLADRANDIGMRLGIGEISENPMVRTIASQMERLPFSGARARADANQEAFNRAVGATFGAADDKITPEVFASAKGAIGGQFDDLSARNALTLSPDDVASLRRLLESAEQSGTSDAARMVRGQIQELLSKVRPDGTIPGSAYRQFDSALGAKMKSGGDPAYYLGQIRDVIRGAMDNSISPVDQAAWRAARQQWASLKTVEPLVAKSVDGDISAPLLMGRVTADGAGKARMAAGQGGPLGELARIGQRYLKPAPNSGTADRLAVNLGVTGALGGTYAVSPETSALAALLLAGNRGTLRALSSKALVRGEGKGGAALKGLARLMQPAPRALPALAVPLSASGQVPPDVEGQTFYP